jgi:hypothetical protein
MRLLQTLILLFAGFTSFGQPTTPVDDEHASLLPGKKHSLIAYAGQDHSFTLDVHAHTVKPSDVPGFITIDGQILQSTLVAADRSIDLGHNSPAREQDILTRYMNSELAYYKKKLHQHYSNLQTDWVTLQNRLFLVWYFDMPKNNELISRQIYVSTLFFNQVMDLNAPVFHAEDSEKAKAILLRLAGSMKTYDKHLDLTALGKKLNKG